MLEPKPVQGIFCPGYILAIIFIRQPILMVMFDARKRMATYTSQNVSCCQFHNKTIAVLKGVSSKGIIAFSTHGVQIHFPEGRQNECPAGFSLTSNNSR